MGSTVTQLEAVQAAQKAIAGKIERTPVRKVSGADLDPRLQGLELVFKCEMFQKTGSFKIRGVLNKLASLSPDEKARGVVAMSSGNHAQAVAYGARLEGLPSTIVMPTYAVQYKIDATRALGAQVILCEAQDLLATYMRRAQESDAVAIHPFDDPVVFSGAGTLGLELLEDAPDLNAVVVCTGGGGLLSGVATAVKTSKPDTRIVGVEPEGACAIRKSLDAGEMVTLDSVDTIADGLAPPFTGEKVMERVRQYVDDVVVVTDDEIRDAMRLIIERLRLVVEPSGAAALAGLLTGRVGVSHGDVVGVTLSGGNINAERLKQLL